MDISDRRDRIRANLIIEPISHGQVYTFQIAIPESEQQDISWQRRQLIEDSLSRHKTNLSPVIVRRTEAYSEEEEYEVVYGVDWCLVAKELDTEKLWVWVYDMTDEQAAVTREEMQQLIEYSNTLQPVLSLISEKTEASEEFPKPSDISYKITEVLQNLKGISRSVEKINELEKMHVELSHKVESLSKQVESINASIKNLQGGTNLQNQLDVEQIADAVFKKIEDVLKNTLSNTQTRKTLKSGYNSMRKDELMNLATQNGLKITKKMTKDDIIRLLQEHDKTQET